MEDIHDQDQSLIISDQGRTINALEARVSTLHSERDKMIEMIKRLLCFYEGNYQFSCEVDDFLRQVSDYRGTMHPSTKFTFSELTAIRGGM